MRICDRFDDLGCENPSRPYRLGIFGGTFDPIHIGHLAVGEHVRDALGLDAVIFMPAGVPVFKKDRAVTPGNQRLEMCRLATRDNPCFDVSGMEIERGGDTYTFDTLEILREHYPDNVALYFIAGADAIMGINGWKNADALGGLARFVALTRPGYPIDERRRQEIAQDIRFDVSYVEVPGLNVSSSMLREWVGQGASIRYLTADAVREYIEGQGLYRNANGGVDDRAENDTTK